MIEKIYKNNYMAICDNCGTGQECYNWADVMEFMREEGWKKKLVDGEWKHYCPECQQELLEVPKNNMGRPRTIYREYEKSSQEGLQDNFTRATFIVREDLLKKLKDYAYTERETLKDVVNKMIAQFLDGKEIIEREDK